MALIGVRRTLLARKKMVAVAGGGALTFNASSSTPAWQIGGNSPYIFSADINSASPDRMVVVVIGVDGSGTQGDVTGVTVGVFGMTPGPQLQPSVSSDLGVSIFYLKETTLSGSQNIVVTTSGIFPSAVCAQVGMITGSSTVAFGSSGTTAVASASDPRSVSAASAVPANGVAVIGVQVDRAFTPSWTGATNDKNVTEGGGNAVAMAMAHGTAQSPSFTGANGFRAGLVIATFGP